MRNRIILLALTAFGLPLLLLLAEGIAWFLNWRPLTEWAFRAIPDLIKAVLLLWLIGVAYASWRLVWFITSGMTLAFLRAIARVSGTIIVTLIAFSTANLVIVTWLPIVTMRTMSVADQELVPSPTTGGDVRQQPDGRPAIVRGDKSDKP